MPSIAVRGVSSVTVVETFLTPADASDNTITYTGYNEISDLTSLTSVPATKYSYTSVNLSSGALTLDFTTLAGRAVDQTVDGTALRVQFLKLRNKSSNANSMLFVFGASNPYTGLGAAFNMTLKPGQSALFSLADGGPDVGSGCRTLDITGTGSQTVEYAVVLG